MKTSSSTFALAVTVALLAGCGPKSSNDSSSTSQPSETASTGQQLQEAASKVVAEAAPAVKQQAQETFANLSQQLIDSTKGGSTDALLKNISTDLQGRVSKLATSLSDNAAVKEQLNSAVQALLGNKDIDAIAGLNALTSAKLTPEQTTMVKDVYNAGAALVTQRNFSSIEGMNTDVARLATSVWKGNYTEALTPLQKLYSQATLTAPQKELLSATYDKYMPAGWKDAAGTVQKGLDTLKQFSK
ncbi:MAG TPA: hypothetical protein VFZ59_08460 [Verrucomicrobiae bacterium]|nr:hypothetical protein [Verrucomicrobiae bacterium]